MRKATGLLISMVISFAAFTQNEADTAWKLGGDVSLMLSEASYENWATGGENSISFNSFVNLFALYEKGRSKWENNLGMAYGEVKTGDRDYRKSEDKIDLSSKYGLKAADKWYYSALFGFKTQFTSGYNYPGDTMKIRISDFLAPGFISIGLGMEYVPVEYLSIYISPATARWIIVNEQELADAGAFGVEPVQFDDQGNLKKSGENNKFELGAAARIMFRKEVVKNVTFQSKLELFSDYLENPQNIDINWDNALHMSVNKFLSANITAQMMYDDDTHILDKDGNFGPRTQFKHTLGVGFVYGF
ncbi:MAG: DUF3078 domain-containing protein [Bacteroidales bacterium]|nr:DUF3078 domain-containing protein [Bacteroidales bacterium]